MNRYHSNITNRLRKYLCNMKSLSYLILFFSLLPIYIIFCVKFNCKLTPCIGYSPNADNINEVLLNLSYSYLAATIFYILMNYLPFKIKVWNTESYIQNNIELFNKSLDSLILLLNGYDHTAVIKISQDKINELIDRNYSIEWEEPDKHRKQISKHKGISVIAKNCITLINETLEYRDIIDESTYKSLLSIKSDITLQLFTYDFFPSMCNVRADAKEAVKVFLYNLIKTARSLEKMESQHSLFEIE